MEKSYPKRVKRYQSEYKESEFWNKLHDILLVGSKKLVLAALTLYFTLKDEKTPFAAKSLIVGSLGYLILPIDLIPDYFPGVGLTDDLVALLLTIVSVLTFITPTVKEAAAKKASELYNEEITSDDIDCVIKDAKAKKKEEDATEASENE